jgi:hypothetical protein
MEPSPPAAANDWLPGNREKVQVETIGRANRTSSRTHESLVVANVNVVIGTVDMKPTNVVWPTAGRLVIEKTCPLESVIVAEPTPENPNPPRSRPTAKVGLASEMTRVLFGFGWPVMLLTESTIKSAG